MAITVGVSAVAISDIGKVCLFSAMSGVITLDGKPVANARLVRTVSREGVRTDETTTDSKGNFTFPAMFERTVTKYLPQEFVASQEITAHLNKKEHKIWVGVKRSPSENSESRGKPLAVKCDLNSETTTVFIDQAVYITKGGFNSLVQQMG